MKEIIVNVDNYNENSIKTIEGDNLSEVYKIYICKNKRRIDLTNKIAIMAYVNEYGNKKSNILALNITNAAEGEIELPITNAISSENGVYACQIAILGEKNSLEQTAPFNLIVEDSMFSKISNSVINGSDFQILSEAIKTTSEYAEKLKEGTENIELQYAYKLNEKMNKDDVLSMANMGQDVKEAMTGGSVAVVGENAVLTDNIVDRQVTPEKISYSRKSGNNKPANLLNPNAIKTGFYITSTGEEQSTSNMEVYCTDYIKVYPGKKYIVKNLVANPGAWFDKSKRFIALLSSSGGSPCEIIAPSNAEFLRWNGDASTPVSSTMIIEGDSYPNEYIPYSVGDGNFKYELDWLTLNKNNFKDEEKLISIKNIIEVKKEPSNTVINLLNPATIKKNNFINDTGEEQSTSNEVYCTEFIKVYPTKKYIVKKLLGYSGAWYDDKKKFISTLESTKKNQNEIIAPSNAEFLRWNGDASTPINSTMIIFNGTSYPDEYIPYSDYKIIYTIEGLECSSSVHDANNSSNSNSDYYKDILWATFGDSITWQDGMPYGVGPQRGEIAKGYQTLVKQNIGINYRNEGVSGDTVKDMFEVYKRSSKDFKIASFSAGTNDLMRKTDMEEFKNTLKELCEYISTETPDVQVFFMTPIQRKDDSRETKEKGTIYLIDYVNAIIEVCSDYGFPVIDLYRNGQLNKANIEKYTKGDGLHPIDKGYAKFANLICDMIKKICF